MSRRLALVAGLTLAGLIAGRSAAQPAADAAGAKDDLVHYQVRPGDTLYDLAGKYLVRRSDFQAVRRANHIRDPRRLPVASDLAIPASWLRAEAIDAVVESLSGEATAASPGKAAAALAKGAVLHEGDTVATGANAFVRLALPDGSHVTLPSQSRLRIETLHRILLTGAVVRDFALDTGRYEATVTPMARAQDRFIVKTPLSIAAVRGTAFRVAFDAVAARAGVGVLEGTVGVASATAPGAAAAVPKSFGVTADAGGVSPPRALLPAPVLKDSDQAQQAPAVDLQIEPVPGAQAYRAQIAADAGLLNPIAETQSDQPSLSFPSLADGQWFVRLTAIDNGGLEGAPQTYGFERVLNDVSLKAPAASPRKRTPQWLFEWASAGSGQPTYRFQLFGEAEAVPPVIDEAGLEQPQITVTGLAGGLYHWRVKSTLTRDGRTYEVWSPLQEFRIGR